MRADGNFHCTVTLASKMEAVPAGQERHDKRDCCYVHGDSISHDMLSVERSLMVSCNMDGYVWVRRTTPSEGASSPTRTKTMAKVNLIILVKVFATFYHRLVIRP